MKLRLTQGGFQSYTGQMGVIQFIDGLSVGDVLPIDAVRVAGVIGAEWEDGTPANVSQLYLDNMNTAAPTPAQSTAKDAAAVAPVEALTVVTTGSGYTEEALAAIADKDGISGLRNIAEPLGIKGNSIRGLIDGILKAVPANKAE